jgi:hypothetical protein
MNKYTHIQIDERDIQILSEEYVYNYAKEQGYTESPQATIEQANINTEILYELLMAEHGNPYESYELISASVIFGFDTELQAIMTGPSHDEGSFAFWDEAGFRLGVGGKQYAQQFPLYASYIFLISGEIHQEKGRKGLDNIK